jgi:hypothetical protein
MLKIKNPTDILEMNFVDGKYKLKEAEEHSDRYTFAFVDTNSNWAIIDIFRQPKWDDEMGKNIYRVDNGRFTDHWISVDFFSKIKNVQWTFNEALKDL